LSQQELGERAGVSVRTITDLERGQRTRPYQHTVAALAAALDLQGPQLDEFMRLSRRGKAEADDGHAERDEPSTAAVPRQVPTAVSHFTGRIAELGTLTDLLGWADGARAVVTSVITGTAGAGKTTLAIHWTHQVADRFPDGQLHVNLHGYDPDPPVTPTDVLAGFLRAMDVPGHEIPDELEERAALYRSLLAGRRMLVLLDNACDATQVRPLLPGTPGCVVLVTSRDAMAGLVAVDGARRLDLDVPPHADAVALLGSLIGARAEADPKAVAELADLCARLPLALRIAAELAVARPQEPLADLVTELATGRLDGLDAGEDRADVRAVFSWSLRQLPQEVASAFVLIGLHPGADTDAYATAALCGTSIGKARQMLGRLHRASLLQAAGRGRFGMHELLRDYAREQAAARYPGGESRQALTMLSDYYLATAAAAMDTLYPADAHVRPHMTATALVIPEMPDEPRAREWLNAERANLVALVAQCAGHGWPQHVTGLADTLFRYLMADAHLPEAHTIYAHALHIARESGDLAAEAEALNRLGGIGVMKGHFRDAAKHYQTALDRYRQCDDRTGQARVLRNLGITEHELHNHRSAADYYRRALAAYEDVGDSLGTARTLVNIADTETRMGCYDQASEHLKRALPMLQEANEQAYEAEALEVIGDISLRQAQLALATASYGQALRIWRCIGHRAGEAGGLRNLGKVSLCQGEYEQAARYLRQALTLFREAEHQHGETETLLSLGEALHRAHQHAAAARAELTSALRLAAEADSHQEASAHRDLAESHHWTGENEQARRHLQQALRMCAQLGAPEADQVQSWLSALYAD